MHVNVWKLESCFFVFFWPDKLVKKVVLLAFCLESVQLYYRAALTIIVQWDANNVYMAPSSDHRIDLSEKGPYYQTFVEWDGNSHVSDFSMLPELRKYCGFSMTGIFVIPMITASGPISEDDGVLLPLETWWRGLAESSSLLMTEEEPWKTEEEGSGIKQKTHRKDNLINNIYVSIKRK